MAVIQTQTEIARLGEVMALVTRRVVELAHANGAVIELIGEACRSIGLRSMIVVPLRHHDEAVGVLKVMAIKPSAFDEEDVHVLGLLSDLVAATMFHAARHERDGLLNRATKMR